MLRQLESDQRSDRFLQIATKPLHKPQTGIDPARSAWSGLLGSQIALQPYSHLQPANCDQTFCIERLAISLAYKPALAHEKLLYSTRSLNVDSRQCLLTRLLRAFPGLSASNCHLRFQKCSQKARLQPNFRRPKAAKVNLLVDASSTNTSITVGRQEHLLRIAVLKRCGEIG